MQAAQAEATSGAPGSKTNNNIPNATVVTTIREITKKRLDRVQIK